jgi:hypothetical protein
MITVKTMPTIYYLIYNLHCRTMETRYSIIKKMNSYKPFACDVQQFMWPFRNSQMWDFLNLTFFQQQHCYCLHHVYLFVSMTDARLTNLRWLYQLLGLLDHQLYIHSSHFICQTLVLLCSLLVWPNFFNRSDTQVPHAMSDGQSSCVWEMSSLGGISDISLGFYYKLQFL